jgi:flagellar basal body-associated protein FliL
MLLLLLLLLLVVVLLVLVMGGLTLWALSQARKSGMCEEKEPKNNKKRESGPQVSLRRAAESF